jgi:hypothetical protein
MAKRVMIEVVAVTIVLAGLIAVYDGFVAPNGTQTQFCILPEDSNLGDIKGLSEGDLLEVDVRDTACPPCGVLVEITPQIVGRSSVEASRVLPCDAGTGTS